MLTIMQKQSKMMEVELKNKKQALLEARASLEAKTARVVELEEQLKALAPTDEERAEEQQVVIQPSRLVVSVRDTGRRRGTGQGAAGAGGEAREAVEGERRQAHLRDAPRKRAQHARSRRLRRAASPDCAAA